MAVAIGAITSILATPTTITVTAPTGTANTGAMTYQWYRSTTPGFVPGAGNIIAGATGQSYEDVVPADGTQWAYVCIVTDTLPSSASTPQLIVGVASYNVAHPQDEYLNPGNPNRLFER